MTQRIFDVENEKDMADLWDIVPEDINKIVKDEYQASLCDKNGKWIFTVPYRLIKINWHNKTEITRPIQEATEADVGKLCYFWDDDGEYKGYAILSLKDVAGGKPYYIADGTTTYDHCRRLTKQEIEELC